MTSCQLKLTCCVFDLYVQLEKRLNERDEHGALPLELALKQKQKSIAETLVRNKVDMNVIDHQGQSLIHKALNNGEYCRFWMSCLCFSLIRSHGMN